MKKILSIVVLLLIFTTCAFAYDELSKGSKGDAVAQLQQALINQGYLRDRADGDFGKKTEAAVSAFQKAIGLPETGIANDTTQAAIFEREEERLSNVVLSRGSSGYDVTQLQDRLIELGYLTGIANGAFDNDTEAALIIFQARNGLSPTGTADKAVRDALFDDDARAVTDEAITIAPTDTDGTENDDRDSGAYLTLIDPEESFVIERLKLVDDIAVIAAATEDNDPNGHLHKPGGYTAQIYFSSTLVSDAAARKTPEQVIDDGTDGGGSVEVYRNVADAKARETHLAAYDGTVLSSGSHKVVGSCLIRTSDKLNATEQNALEEAIIQALTLEQTETATEPEPGPEAELNSIDDEDAAPDSAKGSAEATDDFLFNLPVGSGYVVGEDIQAGMYLVQGTDYTFSSEISIKGPNGKWDYLALDFNDKAHRSDRRRQRRHTVCLR